MFINISHVGNQVEKTNLVLENLMYEKNHYVKEIQACRAFKSAFTDAQIDLHPLEQFRGLAQQPLPQEPHDLMLARLAFELSGPLPPHFAYSSPFPFFPCAVCRSPRSPSQNKTENA